MTAHDADLDVEMRLSSALLPKSHRSCVWGREGGVEGLGGLVWAVVGEGGSESLGKSLQSSCLPTCNTEGSGARWSHLLHVLIEEDYSFTCWYQDP